MPTVYAIPSSFPVRDENNPDHSYSCPRDWRSRHQGGPIEGAPVSSRTSQHYCIDGSRGDLNWSPLCRETRVCRTVNVIVFQTGPRQHYPGLILAQESIPVMPRESNQIHVIPALMREYMLFVH